MIIDVVFILEKQQLFCSFVPAKPDIKEPQTETQATNYLIQQQRWQEKLLKIVIMPIF
ncbi:MAG: hypothetical protein IPN94_01200 [Sphingobacteriales bacterium]|nr:hypothetical protein [Sphingobacteriales bacterium]